MLAAGASVSLLALVPLAHGARPTIELWKDPNCGCCAEWVKHVEANGFAVNVNNRGNNAAR